ncbi:hypothetical protein BVC71_03245 [Marivivens niveibacter]|uniref:Uncharacterized protein n=1 Tax=Marivivens niveibacter TaxID=1930667 RepID=A0A251X1F4_9RHOB|nr:hypothetical protein [Marivivens niveibacter]OUD10527.1 hypothetical protein BVC71_03245 [Marivivens niveibacter]
MTNDPAIRFAQQATRKEAKNADRRARSQKNSPTWSLIAAVLSVGLCVYWATSQQWLLAAIWFIVAIVHMREFVRVRAQGRGAA